MLYLQAIKIRQYSVVLTKMLLDEAIIMNFINLSFQSMGSLILLSIYPAIYNGAEDAFITNFFSVLCTIY